MLLVDDNQISIGPSVSVHSWECDLQKSLAQFVVRPMDNVLELGLGLGMAYQAIEEIGPSSHLVVELSYEVIAFHRKRGRDIIGLIQGDWNTIVSETPEESYDSIFYDADPPNLHDFKGDLVSSWEFAREAVQHCHRALKPGGRLGFLDFSCMISLDAGIRTSIKDRGFRIEHKNVSIFPPIGCTYAPHKFCHLIKLTKM